MDTASWSRNKPASCTGVTLRMRSIVNTSAWFKVPYDPFLLIAEPQNVADMVVLGQGDARKINAVCVDVCAGKE